MGFLKFVIEERTPAGKAGHLVCGLTGVHGAVMVVGLYGMDKGGVDGQLVWWQCVQASH